MIYISRVYGAILSSIVSCYSSNTSEVGGTRYRPRFVHNARLVGRNLFVVVQFCYKTSNKCIITVGALCDGLFHTLSTRIPGNPFNHLIKVKN